MSQFNPSSVRATLKLLLPLGERVAFEKTWNYNVQTQVEKWCPRHNGHQSGGRVKGNKDETEDDSSYQQLKFIAEVMEYVNYVARLTTTKDKSGKPLDEAVPCLGPYFLPHNSYFEGRKRERSPKVTPMASYLKPVYVISPWYYGDCLLHCPNVKPGTLKTEAHEVAWDGWTPTGHREVHGLWREETAIGYQLRCKTCQRMSQEAESAGKPKIQYCFATTSSQFWWLYEHWQIPRSIPYFLHRCAVTRELYNLIVEFRPSMTASAMEEHIKREDFCHLLEFSMRKAEYVNETARSVRPGQQMTLDGGLRKIVPYSAPMNKKGYNDRYITHDLISDIYLEFVRRTREAESSAYLRTLTGVTISFDHTFKLAKKAKIVHKDGSRKDLMSGGLFSAVNERNEIILWAFCQTTSGEEFGKPLRGYRLRCEEKGVPLPQSATSDICCKVRHQVQENLSEAVAVVQDVNHFSGRYACTVQDRTNNPHYAAVWRSITDSVLEERAENGKPAVYYSQQEQIKRLEATYARWDRTGNVWTTASVKCHAEQMRHAKKGCLVRPRSDVRSDGSRIEGTHRGWNSLMRASPSGLEMLVALGHDHVLRRNTRVILRSKEFEATPFLTSTFGSHHLSLIGHIAQIWNFVVDRIQEKSKTIVGSVPLQRLPVMEIVNSGEKFGLIEAEHIATFGGRWEIKEEEDEVPLFDLSDLSADDLGPTSSMSTSDVSRITTSANSLITAVATSSAAVVQSIEVPALCNAVGDDSTNPIDIDSSASTPVCRTPAVTRAPTPSRPLTTSELHLSQSLTTPTIDLTDPVTVAEVPAFGRAHATAVQGEASGVMSAPVTVPRKRKLSGGCNAAEEGGHTAPSSASVQGALGQKKARLSSSTVKNNAHKVRTMLLLVSKTQIDL
ncbi:hypothetical protein NM688_g8682 [Phlebia brevispora]|uniref:Uncharacterized protein n=1 Tax=Phlebia brevispora TaxID=194682 RepID=A0ACC1RQD7_9APHY|nr:hypothetical protein NM688_g8682 [Phlebia brevispora]